MGTLHFEQRKPQAPLSICSYSAFQSLGLIIDSSLAWGFEPPGPEHYRRYGPQLAGSSATRFTYEDEAGRRTQNILDIYDFYVTDRAT